jgi:hypothetical protein
MPMTTPCVRTRSSRARLRSLLAATLLFALPCAARAGSTDPVLVIGQARASGTPARLVDLLGAWGFDDALQVAYPLNVVVIQGTSFVRFPVGDAAESGTLAGLSDGLAIGEIAALEAAGSPSSDAAIVRFALHEMTLALPGGFAPGSVDVVLYTTVPGEGVFLSNTVEAPGAGS